MDAPVKLDVIEGIARITLNRPKVFNALDLEAMQLLADQLLDLSHDNKVIGILITGANKAFCTGADLKWASGSGKSYASAFYELAGKLHHAILEIRRMPKPIIASINGVAAGSGLSMALACDFRIMESSAILKQAYTSNGLSIDGSGTFFLPRLVGLGRSMVIATFDPSISAEQALCWGLVTEIAEDGQSVERAIEMLQNIKTLPLTSFAASKKLLNDSFNNSFEAHMQMEREFVSRCAGHPNGREGIAAFLEKRKPYYNQSSRHREK